MGRFSKAFYAGAAALSVAGATTYVSVEMLPTVISDLGGHTFKDERIAATIAQDNEVSAVKNFDLSKPAGPTDLGVDLANARLKAIVAHCSQTERANALTAPLNRAPCAEAPLSEKTIKDTAVESVRARHAGTITSATWAEKAYDAGVVGAQGLTVAFGFYVAFGVAGMGFSASNGNNRTGGGRRKGKEGASREKQLDLNF